jgi:hypothetical protein
MGIESQVTYQTMLLNPGVCGSSEHDALVSSEPVVWVRHYLKLKLTYKNIPKNGQPSLTNELNLLPVLIIF